MDKVYTTKSSLDEQNTYYKQQLRWTKHILQKVMEMFARELKGNTVENDSRRTKIPQGYLLVSFCINCYLFQKYLRQELNMGSYRSLLQKLFLLLLFSVFQKNMLQFFCKIFKKYFRMNSIVQYMTGPYLPVIRLETNYFTCISHFFYYFKGQSFRLQ